MEAVEAATQLTIAQQSTVGDRVQLHLGADGIAVGGTPNELEHDEVVDGWCCVEKKRERTDITRLETVSVADEQVGQTVVVDETGDHLIGPVDIVGRNGETGIGLDLETEITSIEDDKRFSVGGTRLSVAHGHDIDPAAVVEIRTEGRDGREPVAEPGRIRPR